MNILICYNDTIWIRLRLKLPQKEQIIKWIGVFLMMIYCSYWFINILPENSWLLQRNSNAVEHWGLNIEYWILIQSYKNSILNTQFCKLLFRRSPVHNESNYRKYYIGQPCSQERIQFSFGRKNGWEFIHHYKTCRHNNSKSEAEPTPTPCFTGRNSNPYYG